MLRNDHMYMLPVTPRPVYSCIAVTASRGARAGVWGPGGYTGWVIRGHTDPAALLGERLIPAKRAPEAPARGLEWVGIKLGRYRSRPTLRARSVTPGALPGLDPPLSSQTAVQTCKTLKTVIVSEMLVKTWKCHRKVSKRPTIVPVLKTAS